MANEGTIRIHRSIGGTGAAFRVTFVPYGGEGEEAAAAGERSFHELQQVRAFLKMLGLGAELIKDALRQLTAGDRKSTRLNSSHTVISYAVFCLKKKNKIKEAVGIK